MAAASLVVRISAQLAEFQKSFDGATKTLNKFSSDFEGTATRAAAVGSFFGSIAADIAGSLAKGFGSAIKDAIKFSSEFSNAFIGLSSVARAFGTDANLAKEAARKLSADGLLPLRDSATGLKNLLATGFSLPQATQLMNAFKDSAAFGRQGALSFGDAIRSATEGVKNGNSILVDNAGITKNLSQILKEAGFSAQDLSRASSDASVRMALFNGILKESAAFTGDAEKLTRTYSGTVQALDTSWHNLLATWGDAITQNRTVADALGFVQGAFQRLNGFLSDNRRGFLLVSDAVIAFVQVLAGAVRAINTMQGVFNGLDSVLVGVARGMLQSVKTIADSLIDLVAIASKIPGGSLVIGAMAREIATLATISGKAGKSIDVLGDRIADNDRRSVKWDKTLGGVATELDGLAANLKETRGQTVEFGDSSERAGRSLTQGLAAGATKAAAALKAVKTTIAQTILSVSELNKIGIRLPIPLTQLPAGPGLREGMAGITRMPGVDIGIPPALSVVNPFREAFAQLGKDLPGIIFGTLQHGGSMFGAIASGFAAQFASIFQKAVMKVKENLAKGIADALTGSQKAAGTLGVGLAALVAGFGIGSATNKTKGTLGGAAAGAVAGLPLAGATGGASVLIGAGIGALAGFFGGRAADKKNQAALREQQAQVLAMFGGFDALKKKADELGVSIGNAFTTKKPAEFQAAMERLNKAIEDQKKRWEGLQIAVEGVNKKAELFAAPFKALIDSRETGGNLDAINKKLAETAQRGQAEFERLGTFVGATFAGMVKETGDAIGAISALTPAFQVLQDGVKNFGLTSSGTIDQLLGMFGLVNDAVTGPILQSIQATGQIFSGLQQAGFLTADLFQTVATDIGASFRDLEAKGGDVAKAMALSQPVLQKLWEAQQIYGDITDDTTRSLLKQAEEQGLVGERMKDVNQKILDVLIAIADVFGAKLPAAFRNTTTAAADTARGIQDSFNRIRIAPVGIDVDVRWNIPDFEVPQPHIGVPALARGGIVRRPTLALVGESGPEAVVPLTGSGGTSITPLAGAGGVVFEQGAISISAIDGASVQRVVESQTFADAFERVVVRNTTGVRSAIKAAV